MSSSSKLLPKPQFIKSSLRTINLKKSPCEATVYHLKCASNGEIPLRRGDKVEGVLVPHHYDAPRGTFSFKKGKINRIVPLQTTNNRK